MREREEENLGPRKMFVILRKMSPPVASIYIYQCVRACVPVCTCTIFTCIVCAMREHVLCVRIGEHTIQSNISRWKSQINDSRITISCSYTNKYIIDRRGLRSPPHTHRLTCGLNDYVENKRIYRQRYVTHSNAKNAKLNLGKTNWVPIWFSEIAKYTRVNGESNCTTRRVTRGEAFNFWNSIALRHSTHTSSEWALSHEKFQYTIGSRDLRQMCLSCVPKQHSYRVPIVADWQAMWQARNNYRT